MIRRYLFIALWVLLVVFLITISSTFRNKTEAMVAVVESQVTAISFQKPVIIDKIFVVPGQEVRKGDTILKVKRPDLTLDIEKKENELQKLASQILQVTQEFESKKALIQIDTQAKLKRRQLDLAELNTKLVRQNEVAMRLGGKVQVGDQSTFYDTLTQVKISSIKEEIIATKSYTAKELERLKLRMLDEKQILEKDAELVQMELLALNAEYDLLNKVAIGNGIVGTVNVQLDELVPPYTNLISIYERNPTLIKAYMNEKITYQIDPGAEVEVVSENRLYRISGVVRELGARVVSYPNKIQPANHVRSYGQEIFIDISEDNRFLNGEKVFVYPIEVE